MAETVKAEETPKAVESVKYIATENCFFEGRYLKRGDLILLSEKPNHKCLVKYTGKEEQGDKKAELFDPVSDELERQRIMAAMPGFMR